MDMDRFYKIFESVYVVQDVQELFWLVNMVEKLRPSGVLEIGVERGGSLRFWLEVLCDGGVAIGVDSRTDMPFHAEPSLRPIAKQRNIKLHLIQGFSEDLETVEKVKGCLDDRKVDFLFIDATHTNEAVRQDFNSYVRFVRNGGLVGFHDINDVMTFFKSLTGNKRNVP